MAVGKTLAQVLEKACFEVGLSAQAALNQDVRARLKSYIVDEQERLLDEYDWPDFKGTTDSKWFDVEMAAGQRYYDWPSGMDPNTITGVAYQYSGVWNPLPRGITLADYTAFNSDDDVRVDPPIKWDWHTGDQFEVWPMPASDALTSVRFEARQLVTAPVAESAVLVLDHIILAKFAAASYYRAQTDETGESRRLAAERYAEGMRRLATLKVRKGKGTRINLAAAGQTPHLMDPRFRIRVVPTAV